MSRRDGRESDSKRHRSKFDREPSPKRSRRDGKPATERPSSNLNLDVGDHLDRHQKHRQRLQDALPLEAPPPSKVETGAGKKEYDKRPNEPRERSKRSSNPTEVPQRKEFDKKPSAQREDKRPSEQREGSKRSSYPTEVPQRKEFDQRTNEQREGSKNSSNPTEVPRSQSYFQQHDERGIARQGGRTTDRGAATERGWRDSKDPRSERAVEKPSTRDTEQREEKSRTTEGGEEIVWRHDGFFELEGDQPPTTRRRPFREKKVAGDAEHAEKAPAEPVKPSNPDFPILGSDRRAERGGHGHHSERPEKASVGDKEGNRGEAERGSFPLRDRYGGGNNYRGRERFNGSQGYPPPRGGVRVEKWKHDLFEEGNTSPTQENEEDQIAKVEALLAS